MSSRYSRGGVNVPSLGTPIDDGRWHKGLVQEVTPTREDRLAGSGFKYEELTPELRRQYDAIIARGGDENEVNAFLRSAPSSMAQQKQLAPFQKAGVGQLGNIQGYAQAGNEALEQQMALLGLRGGKAMESAFMKNPAQAFAQKQMEQSLLRNQAATGGLRGSGVQKELAQLTSGLTNQNIQQQLAQLGQISGRGQQASTGLYNTGYDAAQGVASIYGQGSADQAGLAAGYAEEDARRDAARSGKMSSYGAMAGYALGGPAGSYIGSALGGLL